jgi:Arc/MetJ-type ribon-helix-helix transcriptional regulator
MTKETVRYPDEVVDAVEDVIEDGVFESKSEFYRFSAEYVLDAIVEGYDPETLDYDEIVADLRDQHDFGGGATDAGEEAFLAAFLEVRKQGLRGEYGAAEDRIDEAYAATDVEAVVLEELLDTYRD